MTWVKISDDFWRHPKVRRLVDRPHGIAAIGLWAAMQSWIGEALTDGLVPTRQPTRLLGVDASDLAAELVAAGLWEHTADGWQVHDYLDYNPSRAKVMEIRERRTEAGKKGGDRNAANADHDGRRDLSGQFTKRLLGPLDGTELGSEPSNQPGREPTPSPVSRSPDSDTPESTSPPPPSPSAERGRRSNGTSPRDEGRDQRTTGRAPRTSGANPRARVAAEKRGKPVLAASVLAAMAQVMEGAK